MNELLLIKQDGCPNLSTTHCRQEDGMSFEEIARLQDQMLKIEKMEERHERFLAGQWPNKLP